MITRAWVRDSCACRRVPSFCRARLCSTSSSFISSNIAATHETQNAGSEAGADEALSQLRLKMTFPTALAVDVAVVGAPQVARGAGQERCHHAWKRFQVPYMLCIGSAFRRRVLGLYQRGGPASWIAFDGE